jgi:hypothetical protein
MAALRAPVFLGSLTRKIGRCAPSPAPRRFAAPSGEMKKMMVYRENPAKNLQYGKKSVKMLQLVLSTNSSKMPLQVVL